jgi:hypothetical protein
MNTLLPFLLPTMDEARANHELVMYEFVFIWDAWEDINPRKPYRFWRINRNRFVYFEPRMKTATIVHTTEQGVLCCQTIITQMDVEDGCEREMCCGVMMETCLVEEGNGRIGCETMSQDGHFMSLTVDVDEPIVFERATYTPIHCMNRVTLMNAIRCTGQLRR